MKPLNPNVNKLGGIIIFSSRNLIAAFLLLSLFSLPARSQTTNYWKTSAGGSWNTTGNWTPGSVPTATTLAVFNTNTLNGAETITISPSGATALGLVFSNTGSTTIQSSSTATRTLTISTRGILVSAGAGAVNIGTAGANSNVNIALSASQGWTNNSANTLSVYDRVSGAFNLSLNGTGNTFLGGVVSTGLAITKNGTGTVTLAGANSYSGGTTLNAGTVAISNNTAFGTGAVTVASNATVNALATLQVTNNYSISSGATATFDVNPGFTLTNTGVISGVGALTKTDTGTLALTGTNTYSGTTTISGGTLSLSTNGVLSSSTNIVVNSGGTLLLGANNQVTTNSSLNLAGGTLSLGGGSNRAGTNSLNTLTLTANSVIDFSALSGNSVLNFNSIIGLDSFTLSVLNWNGTTQWGTTVGTNTTQLVSSAGLTATQLSNISFYSGGTTNSGFLGTGVFSGNQIIPVPEPAVIMVAALLLTWIAGGWYVANRSQLGDTLKTCFTSHEWQRLLSTQLLPRK